MLKLDYFHRFSPSKQASHGPCFARAKHLRQPLLARASMDASLSLSMTCIGAFWIRWSVQKIGGAGLSPAPPTDASTGFDDCSGKASRRGQRRPSAYHKGHGVFGGKCNVYK